MNTPTRIPVPLRAPRESSYTMQAQPHALYIVDFDPSNVFLTREETTLVLNFPEKTTLSLTSFFTDQGVDSELQLLTGDVVSIINIIEALTGDLTLNTGDWFPYPIAPLSGGLSEYQDNPGKLISGMKSLSATSQHLQLAGIVSASLDAPSHEALDTSHTYNQQSEAFRYAAGPLPLFGVTTGSMEEHNGMENQFFLRILHL